MDQSDVDDLNIDLYDHDPCKRTLPMLLLKLGQELIERGHHQDPNECWLSLAQVADYCRRYKLIWGGPVGGRNFQTSVADLFQMSGDVKGAGVRIEHKAEWNERRTHAKLFLKFSRVYPDGRSN